MKQIIIDNDGGTDDFLTIQYTVLSRQFDIKAITLVAGNTDVENVQNNVFKALEMSGVTPEEAQKIGVYAPRHINHGTISDGAQGSNGLGGVEYQVSGDYKLNEGNAEDILIQTVAENPGNISILAIGPLTNIANAVKQNPNFVQNVDELVIMGGDEGGGNITPYAEFNIYQDPEAAKIVFEAGFRKITMIGFNVSKHFTLAPELEHLFLCNHIKDSFTYDITRDTANLDRNKNKTDGASINDALTAMYLLNKDSFESKSAKVDVDISHSKTRGRTNILNSNEKEVCNIVTGIDKETLTKELMTTIFPNMEEKILLAMKYGDARNAIIDELSQMFPNAQNLIRTKFSNYNTESVLYLFSIASELIYRTDKKTIEKLLREYIRITFGNEHFMKGYKKLTESEQDLMKEEFKRSYLTESLILKFPKEKELIHTWIDSQSQEVFLPQEAERLTLKFGEEFYQTQHSHNLRKKISLQH